MARKLGYTEDGRRTPDLVRWRNMMARCTNPSTPNYHRYGGRGIKVCERWQTFENFYADMGPCPEGMSLDRIDNDGPYSPENCRWATRAEQQDNTERSIKVWLDGEFVPLKEACLRVGLSYNTAHNRVKNGWTPQQAVDPVKWKHLRTRAA